MLTEDLLQLFSGAVAPRRRQYKASDVIFRQGDTAEGIFAVEEGRVRLDRYTSEGRTTIMHMAEANESFAEASLFSKTYHCDATATVPSRIVLYPKGDVLTALRLHPLMSIKYIALLSGQVKTLRARLELRSVLSARERILQYLLLYVDPNTRRVTLPGTLKDLAAELGLAHESVYRELKKLEEDGLIERNDSATVIHVAIGRGG